MFGWYLIKRVRRGSSVEMPARIYLPIRLHSAASGFHTEEPSSFSEVRRHNERCSAWCETFVESLMNEGAFAGAGGGERWDDDTVNKRVRDYSE